MWVCLGECGDVEEVWSEQGSSSKERVAQVSKLNYCPEATDTPNSSASEL